MNMKIIDRNHNNQHVPIIYNRTYVYDDIPATFQLKRIELLFSHCTISKVARSRIYRRLSEDSDAYVTNFLESLLNKGKKFKL